MTAQPGPFGHLTGSSLTTGLSVAFWMGRYLVGRLAWERAFALFGPRVARLRFDWEQNDDGQLVVDALRVVDDRGNALAERLSRWDDDEYEQELNDLAAILTDYAEFMSGLWELRVDDSQKAPEATEEIFGQLLAMARNHR